MALTRKKITVRGKRKTYQRMVMVKANPTPIKRTALKAPSAKREAYKPSGYRGKVPVSIKNSLRGTAGKKVRNEDPSVARDSEKLYRGGLTWAGISAGMNAGRHIAFRQDPNFRHGHDFAHAGKMLAGAAIGGLAGYAGARLSSRHVSTDNKARIGLGAHLAGMGGLAYNAHASQRDVERGIAGHSRSNNPFRAGQASRGRR